MHSSFILSELLSTFSIHSFIWHRFVESILYVTQRLKREIRTLPSCSLWSLGGNICKAKTRGQTKQLSFVLVYNEGVESGAKE